MLEQEWGGESIADEAGWAAAYAAITAELAFEPEEKTRARAHGVSARAREVCAPPRAPVQASVSVNRVIESALPQVHRAAGPGIEVTADLEPDPLAIHARAARVEQLVLALARAARDAMPGGGRLTLRTRSLRYTSSPPTSAAGRYVVLSAADTGPAASGEERAGLSPASDLLLASVRGIVDECGGWIQVSGVPGMGTEYRIHFPSGEQW
jgi:signal transduction histidine kinase